MNNSYKIFSGTNSRYLAEEMCKHLGIELGKMNTTRFSDGEFAVSFEESVRGCDVFLVQSTFPNSDNLMELPSTCVTKLYSAAGKYSPLPCFE